MIFPYNTFPYITPYGTHCKCSSCKGTMQPFPFLLHVLQNPPFFCMPLVNFKSEARKHFSQNKKFLVHVIVPTYMEETN